jgi:predicted  nucleic acid-binding Zn-ribbon protein
MENRVNKLETDMTDVKTRLAVAESNIKDVKEDIRSIKDDTKWLRQAITNALITVTIAGILGGGITIVFQVFKG